MTLIQSKHVIISNFKNDIMQVDISIRAVASESAILTILTEKDLHWPVKTYDNM